MTIFACGRFCHRPLTETATFQNYPTGATRSSKDLFDHTDFGGTVYTRSNFLNGGYNSQVGLSKSIKVYPGDVIHAEVYAKILEPKHKQQQPDCLYKLVGISNKASCCISCANSNENRIPNSQFSSCFHNMDNVIQTSSKKVG